MIVVGRKAWVEKVNTIEGIKWIEVDKYKGIEIDNNEHKKDYTYFCEEFLKKYKLDLNNIKEFEFIYEGNIVESEERAIEYFRKKLSIHEWEMDNEEMKRVIKETEDLECYKYEKYRNKFETKRLSYERVYNVRVILNDVEE